MDAMGVADEMWDALKERFEERDQLSAEADRHHHAMLEERKQADEFHEQLSALLDEVNEMN